MDYKHVYSDNIQDILREIVFWDRLTEVAYEKKKRYTLVNSDISHSLTKTSVIDFEENDLLLVTGGGRGITFGCVEALASIVRSRVAILGLEDISEIEPEMLNWLAG